MSLTRLFNSEPFFGLRQFNRIFEDALRGRATPTLWNGIESTTFMPRCVAQPSVSLMTTASGTSANCLYYHRLDLKESPDGTMTASFELPGLTKDDVNIELHGDRLTISGEAKSSSERTENENYVIRERHFGRFSQSLPVPEGTEVGIKTCARSDE